MSSILKALKKLEGQTLKPNPVESFAQIDTKKNINQRVRGIWLFNKFVSMLILIVVLGIGAVGGWFVLSQKPLFVQKFFSASVPDKKEIASPSEFGAKPETEPAKTPDFTEKKASRPNSPFEKNSVALKERENEQIQKKALEDTASPSPILARPDLPEKDTSAFASKMKSEPERFVSLAKKKAPDSDLSQKELVVPPVKKKIKPSISDPEQNKKTKPSTSVIFPEKMVSDLEMLEKEIAAMREMVPPDEHAKLDMFEKEIAAWMDKENLPDSEDQKVPPDQANQPNPKQIDDSRFKIQALVWSDDPKSRMAVINDNVIRTGGSVDGAVVTHIGSDYILLRENGEELRLKFQLK